MKKSRELEKKFFRVAQINIINRTENLKIQKDDLENFIALNKEANFILLTEFFQFPGKSDSYLVQFSWYSRKTKNKIWEINRVYNLINNANENATASKAESQQPLKISDKKKPDQKD